MLRDILLDDVLKVVFVKTRHTAGNVHTSSVYHHKRAVVEDREHHDEEHVAFPTEALVPAHKHDHFVGNEKFTYDFGSLCTYENFGRVAVVFSNESLRVAKVLIRWQPSSHVLCKAKAPTSNKC